MQQEEKERREEEEKTELEIGFGAIGVFLPQSLCIAFLYSFNTALFSRSYGGRAYFTAILEAFREAILGIPWAYNQALDSYPFTALVLGTGLFGLNVLHQRKRHPRELFLISLGVFVVLLGLLFYQRLG